MRTNLLITVIALTSLLAGIATRHVLINSGSVTATGTTINLHDHPALRDMQGNPATLEAWKGRKRLINFWASWCTPCREEMPLLSRLHRQSGEKTLTVIGIALDDPDEVRVYLEDTPVTYPVLLGGDHAIPWMQSLGNHATVLPFSVLTDEQGKIVSTFTGKLDQSTVDNWEQ